MRLVNEIPEDLTVPHLDFDQMRQVVVNLVQNGLEAVAKDGIVTAAGRVDEDFDRIVLEVIDDGRGIAPEIREQIWKPLFTTKVKGTGLGLPIVASIVQRHDGEVFVESTPGHGTSFRLFLPLGAPRDDAIAPAGAPPS